MKKIGLIGGLGPEATIDYYNALINAFKTGNGDLNYPEIIIYSVNMSEFIGLMKEKKYDEAVSLMLEKLGALKDAGADFAAITANTPHMLFDRINEKTPLPLISIVEATCDEAINRGFRKPGLLGTGFTMKGTFIQDVFGRKGIEVAIPEKDDIEKLNHLLFTEIELGIFRDETREWIIDLVTRMAEQSNIDSVILGCTELPLILPDDEYSGIPVLNTTAIHVKAIADYCREKQ